MKKKLKRVVLVLCMMALMIQNLQPISIVAERRIVSYENEVGEYYGQDITVSEVKEPEEKEEEPIEEVEAEEETEETPIEFEEEQPFSYGEEGYGYKKSLSENIQIYQNKEEKSLKQMVISAYPISYSDDGRIDIIETSLIQEEKTGYALEEESGWKNETNVLKSYYPVTLSKGLVFFNGQMSLMVRPELKEDKEPVVKDNQIIYPMEEGVNLRYTIRSGSVKEDIMIYSKEASNRYSYELMVDEGTIVQQEDILVVIDKDNQIQMIITAPIAYDAKGDTIQPRLSYQDGKMIVEIDEEWMRDEERRYPIVIDPEYKSGFNSSLGADVSVSSSIPNSRVGDLNMANYNWRLPQNLLYHAYLYLGDNTNYKDASSFYKVFEDHAGYQALQGKLIKKAILRLGAGDVDRDNEIIVSLIDESYDPTKATYNTMPKKTHEISRTAISAGQWTVDIDITEYIRGVFEEKKENNSILLQLSDPRGHAKFHAFEYYCYDLKGWYTPYVEVTYWDEPEVDIEELNEHSYELRPFVRKEYDQARLELIGLGVDGKAMIDSTVTVSLKKEDEILSSQSIEANERFYIYPSYGKIDGAQNYDEQESSNWQAEIINVPKEEGVYTIEVSVAKDGQESERKSSVFQVIEIESLDTIDAIGTFYGIEKERLMKDNNMEDSLVAPGNLLFIREPQRNIGERYISEDLSKDKEKQIIAALRGRADVCEYGMLSVNYNTGSYSLESSDLSYNIYDENESFKRYYNSSASELLQEFGQGWSYSGNYRISQGKEGATVSLEDGRRYYFTKEEDGSYRSDLTLDWRLSDKGDHHELSNKNMSVIFNEEGRTSKIIDHQGRVTEYQYDGIHLERILYPDGKSVSFEHTNHLISKAILSDGTSVSYEYDEEKNLVGFIDQTGARIRYQYTTGHDLVSWIDGTGNKRVENHYDDEHRVIEQLNALGNKTSILYKEDQIEIKDPTGNIEKIEVDENKWTKRIVYPDGNQEEKSYEKGKLVEHIQENGVILNYRYDERGNLIETSRNGGNVIRYEYDEADNLIKEVNELGEKSYEYDEENHLIQKTNELGAIKQYKYDEEGKLIEEIDELGNSTRYEHDEAGKVSKKINADKTSKSYRYNGSGYLIEQTDELGNSTKHELNERNQIIKVIQANQGELLYRYDEAGNLIEKTNANQGTRKLSYDEAGNLIEEVDELGNTTKYSYDAKGNLIEIIYPDQARISYLYDARDRLVQSNENGRKTSYSYGKHGIAQVINEKGQIKSHEYDELGRLIQITDYDGKSMSYEYDGQDRLIKEVDKHGNVSEHSYDAIGNLIKIKSERKTIKNEYDAASRLIKQIELVDQEERIHEYQYDAMGNMIVHIDPLGNKEQYIYEASRLIASVDELGRRTSYKHDAMGNVIKVSYPDETSVSYGYDLEGNKIKEVDERGNTIQYRYDAAGNMIEQIDASGNRTSYALDERGRISLITTPMKITHGYSYDLDGNLIQESLSGRAIKEYKYDEHQNLIEVIEEGKSTQYEYDEHGELIKQIEANGRITSYQRDEYHQIIKVSVNGATWERNRYDAYGQLIEQIDRYGKKTIYGYDEAGNLISKDDEKDESYRYDLNDQRIEKKDELGNVTLYHYDEAGNLISQSINGNEEQFRYDERDRLIQEIDCLGNSTSYQYDGKGNLIGKINGEGQELSYQYDERDQLIQEWSEGTLRMSYQYDSDGRVIKQIDGEGGIRQFVYDAYDQLIKEVDEMGNLTQYEYDELGNKIKQINAQGNSRSYVYDPSHRLIQEIDEEENSTSYQYDRFDNIIKKIDANGNERQEEHNEYDQLIKTIEEDGLTIEYKYDQFNHVITITENEVIMEENHYDKHGRLIEKIDAMKNKTSYTYDKQDDLVKEEDALGNVISYSYDGKRQLIQRSDATTTIIYGYDQAGRLAQKRQGERIEERRYDTQGQLIEVIDGLGNRTSYRYDTRGRLIQETDGSGRSTEYRYDASGRCIEVIDGAGNKQQNIYDEIGNKIQTIDEAGNRTTYGYDKASHLIEVQDARGYRVGYKVDGLGNIIKRIVDEKETRYEYDELGRLIKIIEPDGKNESYEYDQHGNMIKEIKKDGTVISRSYDLNGNLISEQDTSYSYDGKNQLIKMVDEEGESYLGYDEVGNLIYSERNGYQISYIYDQYGQKEKVIYPDGSVQSYSYDEAGNLIRTESEGMITEYEHDGAGRIIHEKTGELESWKEYDEAGRLRKQRSELKGEEIWVSEYEYDERGSLIKQIEKQEGQTTITSHEYDECDELIKTIIEKEGKQEVIEYSYSLIGNKITIINGKLKETYEYEEDQLVGYHDQEHHYQYRYDENGNRIEEKREDGKKKSYEYDELGRLIKVIDLDGTEIQYGYDGLGNREKESVSRKKEGQGTSHVQQAHEEKTGIHGNILKEGSTYSKETLYVNDINQEYTQVLTRIDEDGYKNYSYGEARIGDGQITYLLDGQGNVRALIKQDEVIEWYRYDDQGRRNQSEIKLNEYGYNQEAHTEDGLQYLRTRYYDTRTGMFISPDSYLGEANVPLSQNRYLYGMNNPYKYKDPSGHVATLKGQLSDKMMMLGGGSKPPIKKPVASNKNIKIEEYRPSNIQEAHQRNQETAIKQEHTILNDTNKAPIEESKIKEERQTTGQLQGTPSQAEDKIIKEVNYNQPFGVEAQEYKADEESIKKIQEICKRLYLNSIDELIDKPVENLLLLGSLAIGAYGIANAWMIFPVLTAFLGSTAIASYLGAGVYSVYEVINEDEEGYRHLIETLVSAVGCVLSTGISPSVNIADNGSNIRINNDGTMSLTGIRSIELKLNLSLAYTTGYAIELSYEAQSIASSLFDGTGEQGEKYVDDEESYVKIQFPDSPDDFNPEGLRKVGPFETKNGKIIKWLDQNNKAIYEWDEDLNYGAHYHVIGEDGNTRLANSNGETHFFPGDIFTIKKIRD